VFGSVALVVFLLSFAAWAIVGQWIFSPIMWNPWSATAEASGKMHRRLERVGLYRFLALGAATLGVAILAAALRG
jgi:hypothetical protein